VLVLQTIILLVQTDDVLQLHGVALGVGAVPVKVLDVTQTVAAKGELVGSDAESNVADVKCLLAVVRGTRVYPISDFPSPQLWMINAYLHMVRSSRTLTADKTHCVHHKWCCR
jgi:hypothetical protein